MKVMATPAAKRVAGERKLDLSEIAPTGAEGYVQLSDVLNVKGVKSTPLAKAVAEYFGIDLKKVAASGRKIKKNDVLLYQENKKSNIIPLSGMRAVIARRMQESMQTVPQYTNHGEFCVYELKNFLKTYAERNVVQNGIKATFTDLLVKAVAMALKDNKMMNSSFMDTHIEIHEDINVGLAVALDEGLIVPNIKNADQKTLPQITAERKALVEKARTGKLLPEEYSGGTFTISNLGQYPVQEFTPIINIPEAAIMGVGTIVDKVMPIDGNIGIRPMMAISITSDHRLIDGATCGKFMERLQEIILNPTCME